MLGSVHIGAKKGLLVAISTDLDCYVTVTMECEGDLETCLVPFKMLNSMIGYAKDSVSIIATKDEIVIESGWTWRVRKTDPEEFPKIPDTESKQAGVAPDIMAGAFNALEWASNVDQATFDRRKGCVLVEGQPKNLFMGTFGGTKFCCFESGTICSNFKSEVPVELSKAIAEHLSEEDAKLEIGDRFWKVTHKHGSLIVKLQEESWPNGVRSLFPKDVDPVAEIDRKEWLEHVQAAMVVNPNDGIKGGILKHVIEGESVLLRSDGLTGVYEAEMPGAKSSTAFKVSGNYLLEALRNCEEDTINLMANDNAIFWRHGEYFTMVALINT